MTPGAPALLMLAFEFPPGAAVGVQRSVMLAKYLPQQGVTPVVITTDGPSLDAWFGPARDQSLLGELPNDVTIHRVPCPRPPSSRFLARRRLQGFLSLGEAIGQAWAPRVLDIWDRVVRESQPAAVYVSVPPFSVAPLAVQLASRSGLPLILDFRDHWSQWGHNAWPTWLHYAATVRRERACVTGAAAIVGVTTQLVRDLQRAHPHVAAAKFHVITNGYDRDLAMPPSAGRAGGRDRFVIGYAGSFYYSPEMRASVMEPWWRKHPRHWLQYSPRREDWRYRSPFYFFQALARLFERRPDLRARVRVAFAGERPDWLPAQIADFGLADMVEHRGRLSHHACLEFEAGCDALLVTSAKVVGGRDYCIAGKTFEYLTSGRPILGIVTEGEQRDFLLASGGAVVADADDVEGAARAIEHLVDGGDIPPRNEPVLAAFHRRETARRMAALVEQLRGHAATHQGVTPLTRAG